MRRIASFACAILLLSSLSVTSFAQQVPKKPAPPKIPTFLEKLGYKYAKVGDNVWEIPFTGNNLKQFSVRITAAGGDLILVLVKLADRSNLALNSDIAVKLLELNDSMDTVKFALSNDMLYARLELHDRIVDSQEFKYMLDQISGAVDQAYPQIKAFLGK